MEVPKGIYAAGLAATLAFSGAACSSGSEVEPSTPEEQAANNDTGLDISVTWGNNRRELYGERFGQLVQFCDGVDFVEILESGNAGGNVRLPGHIACADQVLTPEDFPNNP